MYDVISPDGFSISMTETWDTYMQAKDALLQFIHRFKNQGYYSKSDRTKITLDKLYDECSIIKM